MTEQDRKDDLVKVSENEEQAGGDNGIENAGIGEQPEEAQKSELELALQDAAHNRDRWLRAVADLDNYKKRSATEKSNILKFKYEELLRDLLPVVDNLERALEAKGAETDPLTEGVHMILGMFKNVLARYEVKEIEALGKPFDPHLHEALGRVPDSSKPVNTIVQEYEKGYLYKDKLLRPSKVMVSYTE